jgi:hypothetical protein
MLTTHCTNPECTEHELAKEVLDPDVGEIICGGCGEPTTRPAELDVGRGEAVR